MLVISPSLPVLQYPMNWHSSAPHRDDLRYVQVSAST